MKKDYSALSEEELEEMINTAEEILKAKKERRRSEVIKKIKELAASINVGVEIIDTLKRRISRKGVKVQVKYRNPNDSTQKWSGRGLKPKWLTALLKEGHRLEQYKV